MTATTVSSVPVETDLPEGWCTTPFENCVEILDYARVPVNSEERKVRAGNVPYYGATGQVGWIDDYLFDEQLLVLGEDGAPFLDKSQAISYIICGKSWVNNHAHVLRAISERTSNTFLKYFLNQFDFSDFVTGSTRLKLTQRDMRRIPVVLPPLAEQKRIVEKIEQLLARGGAARERLVHVPIILKRFRQAVLAAACSGHLTADWRDVHNELEPAADRWNLQRVPTLDTDDLPVLPERWAWRRLRDISERVSVGHVGPTLKYYCSKAEGIPFVRSQNVRPGRLELDDVQYITPEFHRALTKSQLKAGDLLVVRVGANRGDVCVVPNGIGSLNCANVVFARPFQGISEYLDLFCQSKIGRDMLLDMTTGSAQGVLNTMSVAELPIPIPPEDEQEEVIRRIGSFFKLVNSIEKRSGVATARAEKLTQAILSKAFRGELVPTEAELARREGRSYEPASVLLARIQTDSFSRRDGAVAVHNSKTRIKHSASRARKASTT
jgi:type I restriction enzyme, S subunit